MKIVPAGAQTELVGKYITDSIGVEPFYPGMFQALMVVDDSNNLCGAAAITLYRKGVDCHLSGVADSPMCFRPKVIQAVLAYIFDQLECVRLTCIVKKNNKRARALLERLGFCLEGNLRLGYDGSKDALIYGLLPSEFKGI